MLRNIDVLNKLLTSNKLDIPNHRRTVDPSGRNLLWLRQHISDRNQVKPELTALLAMDMVNLNKLVVLT